MTLLEEVGLASDTIWIVLFWPAGSAAYVDLEKAMIIGLLPEIDPAKGDLYRQRLPAGRQDEFPDQPHPQDVVEVKEKMTNFELSETHPIWIIM